MELPKFLRPYKYEIAIIVVIILALIIIWI